VAIRLRFIAEVMLAAFLLNTCRATFPSPIGDVVTPQPALTSTAITPTTGPTTSPSKPLSTRRCEPTNDDGVSPSYQPNTPVRSVVGHGHVLSGTVQSSDDCMPIANAKLELWPEENNQGHPDSSRATLFSDQDGHYRFECNLPDHIHMRISAPGYRTIGVNSYHPNGQAAGTFDIVLVPEAQ